MRVTVCELPHEPAAFAAAWAALCDHTRAQRSQFVLLPEFAMLEPVWESAQFNGDEAGVSSMPSPDQNEVDDIGRSMGVTYQDNEELKGADKVTDRDKHRWELDPASSEDYKERD